MKRLNLFLMLFASFGLITMSSCKEDDTAPIVNDTTISVEGGVDVTVDGADITKDITIKATKKATADIVVNITSNAAAGEATITPAQVTIPAGELSATSKITFTKVGFPEGTAQKKITVTIDTPTDGVKLGTKTTDFSVKGAGGTADPTFSVTRATTAEIVVPKTGDKAETFTVKLSKASDVEQTVTLTAAPDGGVLSAPSVVFAIGDVSKEVTITFQSSVFTSDAITKSIVITAASTTLTAEVASITYTVKGTKAGGVTEHNLDMGMSNSPTYITFADEASFIAICRFGFQETEGYDHAATENFTATPIITGGEEGVDYKFPEGETADFNIKKGESWPEKKIIILPAAVGKTIVFDFKNAPIKNMRETKFEIIVRKYEKPDAPVDYGVTFDLRITVTDDDLNAMTFDHWMVFEFLNYNKIPKELPAYFTYKVTTDDGATDVTDMCQLDMGDPLNIATRYSGFIKVNYGTEGANIPILQGKKLTVTVSSEDVVIGNNTAEFTMVAK